MGDITYTEATLPASRRVGGFYDRVEDLEQAASLLDFDVYVPPRHRLGFFMVPMTKPLESNPTETS